MSGEPVQAGGFLHPGLPSPSPSIGSQTSQASSLPRPRSHPLRPGSAKEDTARRYIEGRLLHISRRYAKKFQPLEENQDIRGYESMAEVAKDLSEIVDVLWLSGTPSLQVPYLLNVALAVTSYMGAFPPSPTGTFSLLRKLDHAFASLLKGEDSVSGEILPGFEGGKAAGMSRTDMVRCRSLVESTRVLAVEVMNREVEERERETDGETEGEESVDGKWDVDIDDDGDEEEEGYRMDVARVYEDTIVQLNVILGGGDGFDSVSADT